MALDRQVQEERAGRCFPVIPVLLPGAEADKVTGFLTRNTWIDLRGGLDNPAALDAFARAMTGESPTVQMPAPEPLCPYRGLEPFHEDDAPLFFGRDKFADDLLQKVQANPLIAVVGPSGSGKSSVVQAGLLPRLRREGWPNKTWEAVIFTPREHPFHSLAKELLPLYEPAKSQTEQIIEARTLAEALAAGAIPLDDPINAALKAMQTANRLLLVVDQFEELFTLTEERYRQPFIESLAAALVIMAALAFAGWKYWDNRPESQISKIIYQSPRDVEAAVAAENLQRLPPSVNSWLQTLVLTGRSNEALDAARKIEEAYFRSRALIRVVKVLGRGRETVDQARTAIEAAQQAAEQITHEANKSSALANVATGLAKLHLYRQARELIDNNNTSAKSKLTAYTAILREHHLERYPDQAKLFAEGQQEEDFYTVGPSSRPRP